MGRGTKGRMRCELCRKDRKGVGYGACIALDWIGFITINHGTNILMKLFHPLSPYLILPRGDSSFSRVRHEGEYIYTNRLIFPLSFHSSHPQTHLCVSIQHSGIYFVNSSPSTTLEF